MSHTTFFLSAVTDEFKSYRDELAQQLHRPQVVVETQERFLAFMDTTLLELDNCIQRCTALVHLVGRRSGAPASQAAREALLARYPDLLQRLNANADAAETFTYTQWEVYLALSHPSANAKLRWRRVACGSRSSETPSW